MILRSPNCSVEWDSETVLFVFQFDDLIESAKSLKPTKRNNLNVSASFYDPPGFIVPVTARVKVILQLLCKVKIDWDDCVTDELKSGMILYLFYKIQTA